MSDPIIKEAQYRRLAKYAGSSPFEIHDIALRDARQAFKIQGIDMRTVETCGVSVKMNHDHEDRFNSSMTRWHVSVKITYRSEES